MISGITQQAQKFIKLKVTSCSTCVLQTAKTLSTTVQSLVATTVVISMATNILNSASASSIWSLINQIQLFFLLLLTRSFIPDDIKYIISYLKIAINLPAYFSFSSLSIYNSIINNFDFELSNNSLNSVGVNSDSSVYNTSPFIITVLITIIVHFPVLILIKLIMNYKTDCFCSRIIKVIKWSTKKIFYLLTFSNYIRALLEMNQFLLITSVYEIYSFNSSEPLRIVSLTYAIMIFILCIFILIFAFYLSISSYTVDEDKHKKLGEIFSRLKMQRKFKLYCAILILRRSVFVILLLVPTSIPSRLLIGVLVLLQLAYFSYICYLRPFKGAKLNIIEITNKAYFLILLSSLAFLNTESDWSPTATSIYIWTISSNSMAIFLISIIDMIITLIIKCKCIKETQVQSNIQVIPKQLIPIGNTREQTDNSLSILKAKESKDHIPNFKKVNLREECKYEEDKYSNVYVLPK